MSGTLITDKDLMLMGVARDHDDGRTPLPWALLHDLTRLIGCDCVLAVSDQDTPRWEMFAAQVPPEEEQLYAPQQWAIDDPYRQHYWVRHGRIRTAAGGIGEDVHPAVVGR
jgi:hypothetical protein